MTPAICKVSRAGNYSALRLSVGRRLKKKPAGKRGSEGKARGGGSAGIDKEVIIRSITDSRNQFVSTKGLKIVP